MLTTFVIRFRLNETIVPLKQHPQSVQIKVCDWPCILLRSPLNVRPTIYSFVQQVVPTLQDVHEVLQPPESRSNSTSCGYSIGTKVMPSHSRSTAKLRCAP